jgi:hypothetical protein
MGKYVSNKGTGLLTSLDEQFSELIPTVLVPQKAVSSLHSSEDENWLFIRQQDFVSGQ